MAGEQESVVPFELNTPFGKDHAYSLAEASELHHNNHQVILTALSGFLDLKQFPADKGIDHPKLKDAGKMILERARAALPFKYQDIVPLLVPSADGQTTKLVFLSPILLDDIKGTDTMYQERYYESFEEHPEENKKLSDSLPVYEQSDSFKGLQMKHGAKALVLGSSYSGNYVTLKDQFAAHGIDAGITVVDYNDKPLNTLKEKGVLRPQDNTLQADITNLPPEVANIDVMYGDFILSCFHPSKATEFFTSVSQRLAPDGVLFLALSCNDLAGANGLQEIPFAWNVSVRHMEGQDQEQYYRATLELYQQMAAKAGLEFHVLKKQPREGAGVCDYYLEVRKKAK